MKKLFTSAALAIGVLALAASAQATILEFELDFEFSGADSPASMTTPWLVAVFDDGGTAGSVDLTLTAPNLTGVEWIDEWSFNLNPAKDPTTLSFGSFGGSAPTPTISTGIDAFKADGDGFFDILFDWPTSASDRFAGGENFTLTITQAGLLAADFDFPSASGGGAGTWDTAAHIQSINTAPPGSAPNTAGSGWIGGNGDIPPIPEPATMLLFGTGLAGLAGISRRKKK